ncbi:MAG: radical SAM family heme chaperone HemW, partial [Nitrospirae bacterium]|nr:radical SAM family heme chaperone HemW [Nitrospirota bacterium]
MTPTSLYVHIPFCLKRCIYCDFVSGIYEPKKADAYIDALKKEISLIFYENYPSPNPLPQGERARGKVFSTLYIGGGTPTALSTDVLKDLIAHFFNHLSFSDNYEATIEVNPGTIDIKKLRIIRSSGINRISIGVQSFNDDELKFLGRIHSAEDARQAVHLAKKAGFENIGIDLIYGIPGQSMENWRRTLDAAVSLEPEHISTYELTVEEGTELYEYMMVPPHPDSLPSWERASKKVRLQNSPAPCGRGLGGGGNRINLPDEDKIIEMYNHAIDHLSSSGFEHYEISNFAKPGCQSRHN